MPGIRFWRVLGEGSLSRWNTGHRRNMDEALRREFSKGSGPGWEVGGVNQDPGISRRVAFVSPSESLLETEWRDLR